MPTLLSDDYYTNFLKGAADAKHSDPNDLSLQVLAYQSGGLVLHSNDLKGQVAQCAADASAVYSFAYAPDRSAPVAGYHEVRMQTKQRPEQLRTRAGFYLK